MSEELRAAVGTFLRRTGGLKVRFDGGRAYVRVPTDWLDDLALYKNSIPDTESKERVGTSWREAAKRLHESGDDEPYAPDPDDCPECQRQERLLGADPEEEWVADEWSEATPHPHATPEIGSASAEPEPDRADLRDVVTNFNPVEGSDDEPDRADR